LTLIPIGRFSKMTRLSMKALRLYAGNGLLPPAFVDPSSGYRYYELAQATRAEVIRVLRSLDMPLDEIRAVVEADDPGQATAQLLVHRERLADRLAAHERMLHYLESIIRRKGKIMTYEVAVTETEPQSVAAVKVHTNLREIKTHIERGFGALMQGLQQARATPTGAPLIVYHQVIDETTSGDLEVCVPVGPDFAGEGEVKGRALEGGTMATTVHRGPYEQISPAYHTITSWISEHGYEIVGPPREIYLNDPRTVAPDELLTRVEFPVCESPS